MAQLQSVANARSRIRWNRRCLALLIAAGMTMTVSAQGPEPSWWDRTKTSIQQTTNLLTFREPLDETHARELYQEGDRVFRDAAALRTASEGGGQRDPREVEAFSEAADFFQRAVEADPESALGQDALFMRAESLFFANRFNKAAAVYQKLQADFPRNRHGDQVAARLFSITQYWIETEKSGDRNLLPINLFDQTRPSLDVDGNAVRVLDQIRYDDPTGRLADDATM
ncbi:MAG: tetratricopeptide repeat protein, partial [Planctomycetota bacterium]